MLSETLAMDEVDKKIVEIVQNNPNITHTSIAHRVNRSQPTVGMRIKRLEKAGILKYKAGLDLNRTDLYFGKIEIQTNNPNYIHKLVSECPYIIHAFRVSGNNNFIIIIASSNIEDLDKVVNFHFRSKEFINSISIQIITEFLSDFVLPMDFKEEECECLTH
jgi:Lrp/AsnC family transcriptional regulator